MSLHSKVNSIKSLEYDSTVKHGLGYIGQDCLAGIFSTFTHSWLACGPNLYIISNSDGSLLCSWEFGEYSPDNFDITCAVELPIEGCIIPLLIIGISSENSNQICFFNPNTRRIVRTIEINYPVRVLCVVEDGANEVNPINRALTKTQGLFAVGCANGSLLLFDLCRGILLKGLSGDFGFISEEDDPVEISIIDLNSVTTSAVEQKLRNCYTEQNNFAVCLASNCNEGVTALHYSFECAILFVGTSSGSFALWNMSDLTCIFKSHSTGRAVISLSLLEPCDDPRHNLYLWICYENYPQAVMYCISFSSKYYVPDYGVYYQGFESAGVIYRLVLGLDENIVARRAINSQSVMKAVSKNTSKCLNPLDCDSYQLRLFVTSYEVYNEGKGLTSYRAVVFDLNQWYKEQMPDEGFSLCLDTVPLNANALWHLAIEPSSASPYQWVRPLEQHFLPTALDFRIWCIEEEGISCLEKLGLQNQWICNMSLVGPSALLSPKQLFLGALSAGLLPVFDEPPDPEVTPLDDQRKYVLTVCLENRAISFIESCAKDWSSGGHPVAGCTLLFLINWLWERHGVYKNHGNRMCIPLFDQSGIGFDVSERRALQHCKSFLETVEHLYTNIIRNYRISSFVVGVEQKLTAMSLVKFYFECCLKLISAKLLPEPNDAGRPSESIVYKFDEISSFVVSKRKQGPFLGDSLVGKTGGVLQWEEEGGDGRYPPPSIQSVLRYCLHPSPSEWSKLSLMLYLYMDILHSHKTLREHSNFDEVKNFQYLLRIQDEHFKIVTGFWFLDHSLFEEGVSLLLDSLVKPADLSDDQHRSVLSLLALQGQEKLALKYLRLKKPPLHQLNDLKLELELLLDNRLVNEAFMFQRKHPELREPLLIQFFKGCISKKLLGPVFGLHLDPTEEKVLLKFLKSSDLKEKGDLQVLLLLSRAKYTEAIALNDRLNSTLSGPKARLESDTRDMIVRGVTGGMNPISRQLANEMRQYRPPPPGTYPKPLSALIKIRSEPDGPLCQADTSTLLSATAKSVRHLSDFINSNGGKRKRSAPDDEVMDMEFQDPPRKKFAPSFRNSGIVKQIASDGPITPFKPIVSSTEIEVMKLVGTPLVKKRGKRFSPLSRPSSILKGKTPEKGLIFDDHGDTPRKTLRFALPENEKRVTGRKSLHVRSSILAESEDKYDTKTDIKKLRDQLKSVGNSSLLEDGGIDWNDVAESSKPRILFSQGIKKTPSSESRHTFLDITVSSAEKKYLESPSRDNELSPLTEAVKMPVPKQLFKTEVHDIDFDHEVNAINDKYLNKESVIGRFTETKKTKTSDWKNINVTTCVITEHKEERKSSFENVEQLSCQNQSVGKTTTSDILIDDKLPDDDKNQLEDIDNELNIAQESEKTDQDKTNKVLQEDVSSKQSNIQGESIKEDSPKFLSDGEETESNGHENNLEHLETSTIKIESFGSNSDFGLTYDPFDPSSDGCMWTNGGTAEDNNDDEIVNSDILPTELLDNEEENKYQKDIPSGQASPSVESNVSRDSDDEDKETLSVSSTKENIPEKVILLDSDSNDDSVVQLEKEFSISENESISREEGNTDEDNSLISTDNGNEDENNSDGGISDSEIFGLSEHSEQLFKKSSKKVKTPKQLEDIYDFSDKETTSADKDSAVKNVTSKEASDGTASGSSIDDQNIKINTENEEEEQSDKSNDNEVVVAISSSDDEIESSASSEFNLSEEEEEQEEEEDEGEVLGDEDDDLEVAEGHGYFIDDVIQDDLLFPGTHAIDNPLKVPVKVASKYKQKCKNESLQSSEISSSLARVRSSPVPSLHDSRPVESSEHEDNQHACREVETGDKIGTPIQAAQSQSPHLDSEHQISNESVGQEAVEKNQNVSCEQVNPSSGVESLHTSEENDAIQILENVETINRRTSGNEVEIDLIEKSIKSEHNTFPINEEEKLDINKSFSTESKAIDKDLVRSAEVNFTQEFTKPKDLKSDSTESSQTLTELDSTSRDTKTLSLRNIEENPIVEAVYSNTTIRENNQFNDNHSECQGNNNASCNDSREICNKDSAVESTPKLNTSSAGECIEGPLEVKSIQSSLSLPDNKEKTITDTENKNSLGPVIPFSSDQSVQIICEKTIHVSENVSNKKDTIPSTSQITCQLLDVPNEENSLPIISGVSSIKESVIEEIKMSEPYYEKVENLNNSNIVFDSSKNNLDPVKYNYLSEVSLVKPVETEEINMDKPITEVPRLLVGEITSSKRINEDISIDSAIIQTVLETDTTQVIEEAIIINASQQNSPVNRNDISCKVEVERNTIKKSVSSSVSIEVSQCGETLVEVSHDTGSVKVSHDTGSVKVSHDTGSVKVSHDTGSVKVSHDTGSVKVSHDTSSCAFDVVRSSQEELSINSAKEPSIEDIASVNDLKFPDVICRKTEENLKLDEKSFANDANLLKKDETVNFDHHQISPNKENYKLINSEIKIVESGGLNILETVTCKLECNIPEPLETKSSKKHLTEENCVLDTIECVKGTYIGELKSAGCSVKKDSSIRDLTGDSGSTKVNDTSNESKASSSSSQKDVPQVDTIGELNLDTGISKKEVNINKLKTDGTSLKEDSTVPQLKTDDGSAAEDGSIHKSTLESNTSKNEVIIYELKTDDFSTKEVGISHELKPVGGTTKNEVTICDFKTGDSSVKGDSTFTEFRTNDGFIKKDETIHELKTGGSSVKEDYAIPELKTDSSLIKLCSDKASQRTQKKTDAHQHSVLSQSSKGPVPLKLSQQLCTKANITAESSKDLLDEKHEKSDQANIVNRDSQGREDIFKLEATSAQVIKIPKDDIIVENLGSNNEKVITTVQSTISITESENSQNLNENKTTEEVAISSCLLKSASPKPGTPEKTFFFGNNDTETFLRASKATFQVGSRVSLSEDESVNPMETAMIEDVMEVEEGVVEEDEESDPRNTCMLDVDLSLHLSEDEIVQNVGPKKVDKSMSTTDTYLTRKSRRSSRKTGNDISKDTKTKTNIQIEPGAKARPDKTYKDEGNEEKIALGKKSFSTQTSDSLQEIRISLGEGKGIVLKPSNPKKSISTQSPDASAASSSTSRTELSGNQGLIQEKNKQVGTDFSQGTNDELLGKEKSLRRSTRGSEIKGILKVKDRSSTQTIEGARDLRIQVIESPKDNCLLETDAEAIIRNRALRGNYKSALEDKDARTNPYEIIENVQKNVSSKRHRRSSVNSQNSDDAKDLCIRNDDSNEVIRKSKRFSKEPEIHSILKKTTAYNETKAKRISHASEIAENIMGKEKPGKTGESSEVINLNEKEVRRSSRKSVSKISDSDIEVKRESSGDSVETGIRGILKKRDRKSSRHSCTSETSGELLTRLKEDFPEERKRSRRYSEEPELHSILRRTGELNKRSRRSLHSVDVVQDIHTRFEENLDQKKKSQRFSMDLNKKVDTQKHCNTSHSSETATDLRIEKDLPDEKYKNRRKSPEKLHSILKNKNYENRSSSEIPSEMRRSPEQDHIERRRSKRYSVEQDLADSIKTKEIPERRSKRLSQSSESRLSRDDLSENKKHSRKSLLLSRYKEEEDRKYCDTSSVSSDQATDLRLRIDEDFSEIDDPINNPRYSEGKRNKKMSLPNEVSSGQNVTIKRQRHSLNTGMQKEHNQRQRRSSLGSHNSEGSVNRVEEDFPEASFQDDKGRKRKSISDKLERRSRSPSQESNMEVDEKKRRHSTKKEFIIEDIRNLSSEESVKHKKSRSLQDFPIRRSTRLLHPILEEIKEEEEIDETPRKKRRSLDDLDVAAYQRKSKSLLKKKDEPKVFSPLVIAESDSDLEASPLLKEVWTAEGYAKERRLTRNQKKVLMRNQQIIEDTPSPSTSTPTKRQRKKVPVPDSPQTPTRSSLRLQKKST